jgi:hypothetical protein
MARSEQKHDSLEEMKRIMGQLVRMPPKPHDQMKLGKPRGKPKKSRGRKKPIRASEKEEQ